MSEMKKKLEELKNKLEELSKSLKQEDKKQDKKEVKKLPPGPKPKSTFHEQDFPKTLSQKDVMRMVKEESCEEDKKDEESKEEQEVVKFDNNGQWRIEKSRDPQINQDWTKRGHKSVFDMSHVNEIAGLKDHGEAKKRAHSIVDSSSAKDETKKKIKGAIEGTKSIKDLASMMSNHILSHSGLNVIGGKKK